MAYPDIDGPYGLVPVKLVSGVPYVGTVRQYPIANNYGTSIFNGDLVDFTTGGTIIRRPAGNSVTYLGVFVGCEYTDPVTDKLIHSQYYPANTASRHIMAYVVDDPNVLFKAAVTSTGTTISSFSSSALGANVGLRDATGITRSGKSRVSIDDGPATTNTLPVRVVELVEETRLTSGNYVEALVKWNAGHRLSSTTGIN